MDLKHYIGLQIRTARKAKGLTQEQMAGAIDRAVETISNIERGNTVAGLDLLERIAKALEKPLAEFFQGAEEVADLSARRAEMTIAARQLLTELSDTDLELAIEQISAIARRQGMKSK